MKDALIDVPVSMIFFNRPQTLKQVFEVVRDVRPTKLFLIQDGAREGRSGDNAKIKECRDIVSNIDWKCEVVKIYSDKNLGCGKRIYTGIKEVFTHVDRTIILEDDIVVSKSFFKFCAELLEKYKDDERIIDIAGMNHVGINRKCPSSYFFSEIGSCWGWATWKRSWDKMEYEFDFLSNEYAMHCFKKLRVRTMYLRKSIIKDGKKRKKKLEAGEKLEAWTYQFMMAGYLNSTLSIVPTKNMVTNIGLTSDSLHATDSIKKIPKGLQKVFFAKRYEIDFPMIHPKYIIKDNDFAESVIDILGLKPIKNFFRKVESVLRRIIYTK